MNLAAARAALSRYWLRVDDAAPLVLVRIAYGLTASLWAVSLVPDFGRLFGDDGLNRTIRWAAWNRTNLFRYVDGEVVLGVALGIVIVGGLVVAAGRLLRVVLPLVVLCQYGLSNYIDPWAIGAEDVLRLLGLYLAAFAIVTPAAFQGRFPGPRRPAGVAPVWGLNLLRLQIALVYLTTALEKLRSREWQEGTAVFHALEIEHLRRFGAPAFVTDWEVVVKAATWGTLAIELALAPLLLWPRTRRFAVVLAIAMHLGFELFLELGFFAPAMIVGILAFVAPQDANRLLRWRPVTI